jgi:hypothetical protein
MRKLHKLSTPTLCLLSTLVGLGSSAVTGLEKPTKVHACPASPRTPPITSVCVAAAIAEEAFLKATQHKIESYMIYVYRTSGQRWMLLIEQGDDTHPGPDGSHWFVYVDRASGATEIDAGR